MRFLTKREFISGTLGLLASSQLGRSQTVRSYELKVAGFYPESQNPAIAESIHNSAINSALRGDIKYDYYSGVPEHDFENVLRNVSEQNYDLIIGEIFDFEDITRSIALDYRSQSYLFGSYQPTPEYLTSFSIFENYTHDAAYIAGIIASGFSQSQVLGAFGTLYSANSYRNLNAFIQGAKEVNSQINVLIELIEGNIDPVAIAEKLDFQKAFGVDLIFAERVGVEKHTSETGIHTISNLSKPPEDHSGRIVTTTLWHFQPTFNRALNKLRNNNFKTENMRSYSGMMYGGCSLTSLGNYMNRIHPDVLEKASRRIYEIRNENYEVATVELLPVSELGR